MNALIFALVDLLRVVEMTTWGAAVSCAYDMPDMEKDLYHQYEVRMLNVGWWRSLWGVL